MITQIVCGPEEVKLGHRNEVTGKQVLAQCRAELSQICSRIGSLVMPTPLPGELLAEAEKPLGNGTPSLGWEMV